MLPVRLAPRVSALALASLLAAPGVAAAEPDLRVPLRGAAPDGECMCAEPADVLASAAAAAAEGDVLFERDPSVETTDPYAIHPLTVAAMPAAEQPQRRAPGPMCRSSDDPRCSRDDSGEAPLLRSVAAPPVLLDARAPRVAPPALSRVSFLESELRGLDGVRGRVDRPPRG
jgi:hypothetical protein